MAERRRADGRMHVGGEVVGVLVVHRHGDALERFELVAQALVNLGQPGTYPVATVTHSGLTVDPARRSAQPRGARGYHRRMPQSPSPLNRGLTELGGALIERPASWLRVLRFAGVALVTVLSQERERGPQSIAKSHAVTSTLCPRRISQFIIWK